jgi:DNA polymerase II large subunit
MIWKTAEKKNETEIQNTMEGHSSKLEQAEDRISESFIEDLMNIKGKTKELLVKQLKTYKRKMQELTESIKKSNLRNVGIEDGEEV